MVELNSEYSSISVEQRVFAKQINLSFKKMHVPLAFVVLLLLLLFYFLSASVGWPVLLPWAKVFFFMVCYRVLSLVYYYWQAPHADENTRIKYLGYLYLSGIIFMAGCFAAMTIVLLPKLDLKGQMLVFLALIGMTSGAMPTMSFRKCPVIFFVMILILPLMYMAYVLNVPNTQAMIIGLFIYLVFMIRSGISFFNTTNEMLWLQEEAIDNEYEMLLQKDEALRANNAKSEFLSRMSHELRTPLNAVIGLNDLMRVDKVEPLTEKQHARVIKINEAAQHLLNLMNDVLDLSRIETGDMEIHRESINIVKVVNQVLALVGSKVHGRQISLNFEEPAGEVWVLGDVLRLKQVLFNLIDNAIKYNRKVGTVTISVAQTRVTFWRVSIIDTGYGLSKEDIGKLFVPFSRLGAELLGIDGTGIGLSYSKQLVELMQGEIGVESKPGQGSCFWFDLPMAKPRVAEVLDEAQVPDTGTRPDLVQDLVIGRRTAQTSGQVHILLVEDNLINQELVIDMLDRADYSLDVVNNGKLAVDACSSRKYDLVLMDCEMPIMDGVRATEIIRQQNNAVPIIALTAHAISGAREKCLNAGMNDFLSKPFVVAEIRSIVEKWTSSTGSSVELGGVQSRQLPSPLMNTEAEHKDKIMAVDKPLDLAIDMDVIERLRQTCKNSSAAVKKKAPLLVRVVDLYLEQSPALIQQLSHAVSENNIDSIVDFAHTLKSSSAAVGAVQLSEIFKNIELSGRKGELDLTKMEQVVSEIHHKFQEVVIALHEILVGEA